MFPPLFFYFCRSVLPDQRSTSPSKIASIAAAMSRMPGDACQVRKGIAPRTQAVLNSFLIALFDWLGVTNVASHMRIFAARPILALRLFLLSLQRR